MDGCDVLFHEASTRWTGVLDVDVENIPGCAFRPEKCGVDYVGVAHDGQGVPVENSEM